MPIGPTAAEIEAHVSMIIRHSTPISQGDVLFVLRFVRDHADAESHANATHSRDGRLAALAVLCEELHASLEVRWAKAPPEGSTPSPATR